jgi:hypothetical protein
MKRRTGVVLLGLVAVLASAGFEGSRALPLVASPASVTLKVRTHVDPLRPAVCPLRVVPDHQYRRAMVAPQLPSQARRPWISADLVVEVPPVVFIRESGKWLFVSTNTRRPPQRSDSFYLIADGKAVIASATLRNQVLAGCGTNRRR